MLKKPFALTLIAVGLILTPSTALADVVIKNTQRSTVQDGTAVSGSVNKQTSESVNIQGRSQRGYRTRMSRPKFCSPNTTKKQSSNRVTTQSGGSVSSSVSKQTSTMTQRNVRKTHAALCRKLPQ